MPEYVFTHSVINKFDNISVRDGHIVVGFFMWDGQEDGRIEDMYVNPEYRRQGLATRMWHEATNYAQLNQIAKPAQSETRTVLGDLWARTMPNYFVTEGIIEAYTD